MNPYNSISEEYRKYLIAFSYNDNTYYTVSGTDLEDETDKILVDAEGRFLLFRSISILREVLMSELRFFDPENLKKWVVASQGITVPYAQFNLDVLNTRMWDYKQLTTSKELFYTMGVVEDYAIQVSNTILHALFEH
jgi:hypothetical protein